MIELVEKLPFMVWDASPDIFSIGSFSLRWYGLLFAAGLMIGFFIMSWIRQRELDHSEYAESLDLDVLLVVLVIGTVVGARLFDVFFYKWDYFQNHLIEILYVWQGGLASHGGTLGILCALWFYTKKINISMLWLLDRLAIPIMLAAACIRLGNFMNSEIIGTVTDVPWAVVFKATNPEPRHPVQLYEAFLYFSLFCLLLTLYVKTKVSARTGFIFSLLLIGTFGGRFLLEYFKMRLLSSVGETSLFSIGQWSSIPLVVAGVVLFVKARRAAN